MDKIGRITTSGVFTEFAVPTSSSNLQEIIAGPDGNLWFTEQFGNKIGRITPTGAITEFPTPTAVSWPQGITAGPDGAIWFTELFDRIGRITTDGVITEFTVPTFGASPFGITSGPEGALWFTEKTGNKIGRITTDGSVTEFDLPHPGDFPAGIVAGPDGALWFSENGAQGPRIGRMTVPSSGGCVPSATSLCLRNGRFKIETTWISSDGARGSGQASPITSDAGYFWFFSSNNPEVVVKALDGCSLNNHQWLFAGGLTNVNVVLKVTDSRTGLVRTYTNPQGTAFQPIQDLNAFDCP